jgi:hypothetical protein
MVDVPIDVDVRDLAAAVRRVCTCPDLANSGPVCPPHAMFADPATVRRLVFARHYRRDAMWAAEWRDG